MAWCTIDTPIRSFSISSVYAPNERARRKDLWEWMDTNLHDGNWLFLGDWNMIEFYDDSIGPSAHLHGGEERS